MADPQFQPVTDPALLAEYAKAVQQSQQQQPATQQAATDPNAPLTPATAHEPADPKTAAEWHLKELERNGMLDTSTGASTYARYLVGATPSDKPEDRLATLRTIYPDAQPVGHDNFIFTNPTTGKKTLYRSGNFSIGRTIDDAASVSRDLASTAGSIAGGAVGGAVGGGAGAVGGTAVAPGPGTVAGGIGGAVIGADVGGALGATTAGQVADSVARYLGAADSRTEVERLRDEGMELGVNAIAPGAGRALVAGGKYVLAGGTAAAQRAADFASEAIQPTLATVSDQGWVKALGSAVDNVFTAAGTVGGAARRMVDQVDAAFSRRTEGAVSREQTGTMLQQGAADAVDRFKSAARDRFGQLREVVGADRPVSIANFDASLQDLSQTMSDAPALAKTLMGTYKQQLFDSLQSDASASGTLRWETVSRIRTEIGQRIADQSLTGDVANAELKRMYGALTTDLRTAAEGAGPKALEAFDSANQFYQKGVKAIEATWAGMSSKGATPETAWNIATGQLRNGSTQLVSMKEQLSPTEWNMFANSVLDGLGRAGNSDGNFAPLQFLRRWQELSPEAKNVLTADNKFSEGRSGWDKLAGLVQLMKDSNAYANTSKTAGTLTNIAVLTGLGGAASDAVMGDGDDKWDAARTGGRIVAGSLLAPWAAAKLLTSPAVVKWATSPVAADGWMASLGRLAGIATAQPDLAPAIGEYIRTATNGKQQQKPTP